MLKVSPEKQVRHSLDEGPEQVRQEMSQRIQVKLFIKNPSMHWQRKVEGFLLEKNGHFVQRPAEQKMQLAGHEFPRVTMKL